MSDDTLMTDVEPCWSPRSGADALHAKAPACRSPRSGADALHAKAPGKPAVRAQCGFEVSDAWEAALGGVKPLESTLTSARCAEVKPIDEGDPMHVTS